MMKRIKDIRNYFSVIVVILSLLVFEIPVFGAPKDWQMEFFGDELAADIQIVPLGKILDEINRNTGIAFFLNENQSDKAIFVQFGFLPLEIALARILAKLNHAIVFGADEKILKVTVIGQGKKPLGTIGNHTLMVIY
jgi:hypothetical protein